ncbi:metallophosphoesterase [Paenibacillus sp. 481]|uniref:metallophosphoesterase n=1 Tax=Paenibacillus sp. 481 TaxID=2835869 RepID=UPI001E62FFAC|nr:metallophosphoesterase [Paenibacillus sp. 481]
MPFLVAGYSFFIERRFIYVRTETIKLERLPQVFDGLRIAHISDIHFGHYFDENHLAQLVQQIQAEQPDMICLTGDLLDSEFSAADKAVAALSQLKAPFGKFAVLGNHDYRRGIDLATNVLVQTGFQVLTNRNHVIERQGHRLAIAGIDDVLDGRPDMEQALSGISADTCCMLLAHEPDWADVSYNYAVDLQLSGHSHGGQVRIPLVGAILLPELGQKYADGYYELRSGNSAVNSLAVYTSRGVGTTIMPVRFSCPPEWTLITLSA